jgi:hypothetical protein
MGLSVMLLTAWQSVSSKMRVVRGKETVLKMGNTIFS